MAKNYKDFDDSEGVWRTVGGRRIFIRNGQDLASAMKESGKFKRTNSDVKKSELDKKAEKVVENMANNKETEEEKADSIRKEYDEWQQRIKENNSSKEDKEYALDKKAKESPDSIDPMTENSTDWEALDKKYRGRYEDEKLLSSIKKEENERLEIAKDIAKEVYGLNEKNASPERIEKEARRILTPSDGEVLEKGEQPFTNSNGEIERSTESLKKWRDDLKKTSENKEGFTQKSTSPFYPDREYTQGDLDKMAEAGVRPTKSTYGGSGWEGVNSDKNLSTKEQAKAITDAMKKKYPDVKISRKSELYSGGSSIHLDIMSSDKDLYVTDADIDKMSLDDLAEVRRSNGFNWWAKDNVSGYKENKAMFTDKDVKAYAKTRLEEMKKGDNQSVRGDEWYLSDYGKKVVTDLNKEANSYTYDDSDAMTDYFNHGTYMWVNIGKWDKPYQVNEKTTKSTNETMNKAIREKAGSKYYEGTKRWGFGYANDDNIPVYQNKIDYSGDFTHANLSKVSNDDLVKIANKQNELYNEATSRQVGDRRTYNGKKDQIFKDTETLRYENGLDVVSKEMEQRGLKPDNQITNTLRQKAYQKYLKEHPNSKMTFEDFKDMRKQ